MRIKTGEKGEKGDITLIIRPVYEPQSDESQEKMSSLETAPQPITVDMIEPRPSAPSPDVPYVVYSDETNPWDVVQGELSTNSLYKRAGEV